MSLETPRIDWDGWNFGTDESLLKKIQSQAAQTVIDEIAESLDANGTGVTLEVDSINGPAIHLTLSPEDDLFVSVKLESIYINTPPECVDTLIDALKKLITRCEAMKKREMDYDCDSGASITFL